jgi:integrase/recombinase XerD
LAQAKARKLRPATIYKYDLLRRQMRSFAETRGLHSLRDFDLDVLETFQAEWHEGAVASLKKLERVKAFFRAALIRRWIEDNPAAAMRGPKLRARPTLPFTREEMASILAAIEQYPDKSGKTGQANALRLRAFVLLLRYSGVRIGDATSLSIERLTRNKIFLYTQKTGVPVYCVLPEFVAHAIETAPRLSEKYFFWTGRSTLYTAIGTWQRSLQKLFKLAGVFQAFAHRFRNTFAVELLLAGVPTEEVAILLGHSNIKITQQHYSPWVRDRQRQLEASLGRAWNSDPLVLLQEAHEVENLNLRNTLPN